MEAFVAKSRELREFAEMLDEFGEEFGEWEARALMKEVNKIPPTCKWSRSQVHRWKKRTDEQARAQAWQFIAELNYGRFDEEDLDEQDAA